MTRPLPPDWDERRQKVLKRDPICRADKCIKPSTDVDHIVPRALDGSDEIENLQGLCDRHHGQKTYRERVSPFEFIDASERA